jgi:hypothetical protein
LFDWTATRWGDLPEVASILVWSSYLAARGKAVRWKFQNPLERPSRADDLRFAADTDAGPARTIAAARRLSALAKKIASWDLFPRDRRKEVMELRAKAPNTVQAWIDAETMNWSAADLIGFLHRYGILRRAVERRIEIIPDIDTLARSKLERNSDSAAMEFRTIASTVDVADLTSELSDTARVAKALGKYANLPIVTRGALASILVTELGTNVSEHANSSGGWWSTRVVLSSAVKEHASDPAARPFVKATRGFFEVLMCDDGKGLTAGLEVVLLTDGRKSVRERYRLEPGDLPSPRHVVDYAFDRLASTKRKLHEIVDPGPDDPPQQGVASGLYWIWNFTRNHLGVLAVRTGGVAMVYDFTKDSKTADAIPAALRFPCAGTMIRVCIPLPDEPAPDEVEREPPPSRRRGKLASVAEFHYVNVSDLTRLRWIGPRRTGPQLTLGEDAGHAALIRQLSDVHAKLGNGDVLLLDLSGNSRPWEKASADPICRFFLSANYTSTVGRSATVLWNVPTKSLDVFEQAIIAATDNYRHLRSIRRAAMMVTSTGHVRIIAASPAIEKVLVRFTGVSALTLSELGVDRLPENEREAFFDFVRENTHLFDTSDLDPEDPHTLLRIRAWETALRGLVWRETQAWFDKKLDTPLRESGIRMTLRSPHGFYRLPSSELLSREFFHFRSFLSNREAFARTTWMMSEIIRSLGQVNSIVAITRPAMMLADRVADLVAGTGRERPLVIGGETLDVLGRSAAAHTNLGRAVLLMTVLSTGRLSARVTAVLKSRVTSWAGVLACLDVRGDAAAKPQKYPMSAEMDGILCESPDGGAPAYPLALREVRKYGRNESGGEPVVAIDSANLCPIDYTKKPLAYLPARSLDEEDDLLEVVRILGQRLSRVLPAPSQYMSAVRDVVAASQTLRKRSPRS